MKDFFLLKNASYCYMSRKNYAYQSEDLSPHFDKIIIQSKLYENGVILRHPLWLQVIISSYDPLLRWMLTNIVTLLYHRGQVNWKFKNIFFMEIMDIHGIHNIHWSPSEYSGLTYICFDYLRPHAVSAILYFLREL